MLSIGTTVRFSNQDAVVLLCREEDALIFIDEHNIKWVDIILLETASTNSKPVQKQNGCTLP